MHNKRRLHVWLMPLLLGLVAWTVQTQYAFAQRKEAAPKELEGVGIFEHRDAQIPLELEFTDTKGKGVSLAQLFDGKRPTILTMNYSDCPMLCSLQLNGLVEAIQPMPWNLGEQYQIITVSIDPLETPERALLTKQKYLEMYGRPGGVAGWHFLTTHKEERIKKLADTVGFGYKYLPESRQFAHAAALIICTPEGRVSRYLGGIQYDPQTLRLSLYEAGQGKVGSAMDQVLMFCFHYDPESGRYSLAANRLMQFGGILTVFVIALMLSIVWLREIRKPDRIRPEGTP